MIQASVVITNIYDKIMLKIFISILSTFKPSVGQLKTNSVPKRKRQHKAWQNFNVNPSLRNYCVATSKQQTFHAVEVSAKKPFETKIVKNLIHNSNPLYHYLNCKSKKSHLCRLHDSDGKLSQSSMETANILVSHFHSVFQNAEYLFIYLFI